MKWIQFKVNIGDFLIARSGAIGRYGIVKDSIPCVFASYIIRFRFDDSIVDNFYFGYLFESVFISKELMKITQGATNKNINAHNIKKLQIPLPPSPNSAASPRFSVLSIISWSLIARGRRSWKR